MPVILRDAGLRFIVYVDDHPPPHVHVEGNDGSAKIAIDPPRLIWSRGLSQRDINRAVDIVEINRTEFGIAWQKIHG